MNTKRLTTAYRDIAIKDISVVWVEAQRPLKLERAQRMADNFDPDAMGAIIVAELPDGRYHCIDGQHRLKAAWIWLLDPTQKVPCIVVKAKTTKEAADLFMKINGAMRKGPNPIAKFKISVAAEYDEQTAVNKLLEGLGYRIAADGRDGAIGAVTVCVGIYKKYGLPALREALLVIQGCWGREGNSTKAAMIKGFVELFDMHDIAINQAHLVTAVTSNVTPEQLLVKAHSNRNQNQKSMTWNVARQLETIYNKGLKAKEKLDVTLAFKSPMPSRSRKVKLKDPKARPSPALDLKSGIGGKP